MKSNAMSLFNSMGQDQQRLKEEAQDSGYLRRLSIVFGVSKAHTEFNITPGHYSLGNDKDCGTEVVAVVGPARPHALHFEDGALEAESFDLDSDTYKQIKAKAKKWETGYSYGPEFLLWLPEYSTFATIHPTRSSQEAGADLMANQGKPVILTVGKRGKRKTHCVKVEQPKEGADLGDLHPSEAAFTSAVEEFSAYKQGEAPAKNTDAPKRKR